MSAGWLHARARAGCWQALEVLQYRHNVVLGPQEALPALASHPIGRPRRHSFSRGRLTLPSRAPNSLPRPSASHPPASVITWPACSGSQEHAQCHRCSAASTQTVRTPPARTAGRAARMAAAGLAAGLPADAAASPGTPPTPHRPLRASQQARCSRSRRHRRRHRHRQQHAQQTPRPPPGSAAWPPPTAAAGSLTASPVSPRAPGSRCRQSTSRWPFACAWCSLTAACWAC
jgi:hypothetical protein